MGFGEKIEELLLEKIFRPIDDKRIWAGFVSVALSFTIFFYSENVSTYLVWLSFDSISHILADRFLRLVSLLLLIIGFVALIFGTIRLYRQAEELDGLEANRTARGGPSPPSITPTVTTEEDEDASDDDGFDPVADNAKRVLTSLNDIIAGAHHSSLVSLFKQWAEHLPSPMRGVVLRDIEKQSKRLSKLQSRARRKLRDDGASRESLRALWELTKEVYQLRSDWEYLRDKHPDLDLPQEFYNHYNNEMVKNYNDYVHVLKELDNRVDAPTWRDTTVLDRLPEW